MKIGPAIKATHVALAIALMVAVFLPLSYFALGYGRLSIILQTEAEANALYATQIINANPEYWPFEEVRLQEFLYRHLIPHEHELRRIRQLNGAIVAQTPDKVSPPLIIRTHDLHESGNVVGKLEIIRSLRPLLWETTLVGALGFLLVAAVFFPLKKLVIEPWEEAEQALREREYFLASVFASISDGLTVLDRDLNILKVNPTVEKRFPQALPLVGKKCYAALHGLTQPCEGCPCHQAMDTGETAYLMKGVKTGETTNWVEIFAFPLKDLASGQVTGVLEYAREITERKQAEEALRQARRDWEEIFQAIGHPTMILDPERGIIDANRATLAALGKTMPEIQGRKCYEFFHPGQDHFPAECPLEKLHTSGRLETMEMEVEALEGIYLVSCTPMLDDQDRLERVIHIVTDVTDRRRAEQALRRSEKRFKDIAENALELIWEVDRQGKYVYASPVVEKLLGYTPEEVLNKHFYDLFHPDEREELKERAFAVFAAKQPFHEFPNRNLHKDGREVWLSTSGLPILDEDGELIGYRGADTDITARRQSEQALRESEEKYRLLVNQIPALVFKGYADWSIDCFDQKIETLTGYPKDDFDSRCIKWSDLILEEDLPGAKAKFLEALKTSGTYVREYRIRQKSGEVIWVHVQGQIFGDAAGKIDHISGVIFDVTDRKRAEEELRKERDLSLSIMESLPGVFYMFDDQGVFLRWNNNLEVITQYSGQEISRMHPEEFFVNRDKGRVREAVQTAFITGEAQIEAEVISKDGDIIPYFLTGRRFMMEGRPLLVGMGLDISERRQMEEALKESEKRFRDIADNALECIWEVDAHGRFTYASSVVEKLLGYKPEEVINRPFSDFFHPDDGEEMQERAREILASKSTFREFIGRHLHKDGRSVWMVTGGISILDDRGNLLGYRGASTDITERLEAEKALKESERFLASIFASIQDDITILDSELNILMVNPAKERAFAQNRPLFGRKCYEVHHGGSQPCQDCSALRTLATGQPTQKIVTRNQADGGGPRYFNLSTFPLMDEASGQVTGVVEVARDITQSRKTEEELARKKGEFEAIFNSMTDGVVLTDTQRRVITANPAFLAMFGHSLEEIRGETTAFLYKTKAEYEELGRTRYHVGAQAAHTIFEMQYWRKDGSLVDCETMGTLVNDLQGRTIGYMGIHRDISERKRAQEALIASEANYRTIFNAVNDGIFVHDAQTGEIVDVNQNVLEFTKRSLEEIRGLNIEDITGGESPYTQKEALALIRKAAEGDPQLFRWRGKDRSGRLYWWEMNLKRVKLGDKACVLAVARNITGRLLAQEALQESEKRYQSMFEDSPISIWQTDFSRVMTYLRDLRNYGVQDLRAYFQANPEAVAQLVRMVKLIDTNKATLKMYEAESKEELLQGLRGIFIDKTYRFFQEVIIALAEGHTSLEGVDVNQTLKGKRINILLKLSVIPGYEETCSQVLISIIDITARQQAEYALQQSNKRYQSLFEDSPIPLWQADFSEVRAYLQTLQDQGIHDVRAYFAAQPQAVAYCADLVKISDANKVTLEIYEAESKEELFQGLRYFLADESYRVFAEIISAMAEGRTVFEGEYLNHTLKGKKVNVLLKLSVIPGFEESYGKVLVSIIDMTERKQAEEAMRKYEFITSASKEYMTLINRDYVYEAANTAYCQAHQKTRDEVVGRKIADIWGRSTFDNIIKKYLDQGFTGQPVEFEGWFSFDGRDKGYYNVSYTPFFNEDGAVPYVAVVTHNITERKEAEEALLESRQRYQSIFENAPVSIFHATAEGKLVDVNPEASRMMGYASPQEMISIANHPSVAETLYVDPQFQPAFMRKVSAGQGQWLETEALLRRKDGEKIVARMLMRQIPGNGGGVEGFAENITERLRAEEEMRQLEFQLLQSQKMEAIGTLAGGIAHDFNNILASMLGYTELALDDAAEGTESRANLVQVLRGCQRAKDLIKQILTFSRQDQQERLPVQVSLIVKEVLKFLRASLPTTIEIRQYLGAVSGKILADPTQIHQVLINLCTNAAQAMEEKGGVMDITLGEEDFPAGDQDLGPDLAPGPYLYLTVKDTGRGMAPEIMNRIFEPFFTTKPQGKGTGLGLSVVHGIVRSHGGNIRVTGEPGQGSTFKVLFPKIGEQISVAAATPTEIPQGHETILLVDDEKNLVDLWSETLNRLGYQVVGKTSSTEALEAFQAQPDRFDLVITDQTMPQMTGTSLSQELLRLRPDIPIILCTGFADHIKEETTKALGIRKIVNKPLSKAEIAVIINKVLGKEPN